MQHVKRLFINRKQNAVGQSQVADNLFYRIVRGDEEDSVAVAVCEVNVSCAINHQIVGRIESCAFKLTGDFRYGFCHQINRYDASGCALAADQPPARIKHQPIHALSVFQKSRQLAGGINFVNAVALHVRKVHVPLKISR